MPYCATQNPRNPDRPDSLFLLPGQALPSFCQWLLLFGLRQRELLKSCIPGKLILLALVGLNPLIFHTTILDVCTKWEILSDLSMESQGRCGPSLTFGAESDRWQAA